MIDPYSSLNEWCETSAGSSVIHAIDEKIKPLLNQLRGDHLLQIGVARDYWHYNFFRFQHVHVLATQAAANYGSITANVGQLPFASESIDCVLAPFTLELSPDKSQTLFELDRVLNPMGYMIIIGINPWSFWGKLNYSHNRHVFTPTTGNLQSSVSLRQNLVKMGYNVQIIDSFYYLPAVGSDKLRAKLNVLNEIGKMLSPFPAGFYLLLAQKFELNLMAPEPVKSRSLNLVNQKISPI